MISFSHTPKSRYRKRYTGLYILPIKGMPEELKFDPKNYRVHVGNGKENS